MRKVTSQDGTIIAFDKKGHGPPLIIVLGALNKRGSGKKLAEQLANQFTIITYDRRGRGDSTDLQPYSVEKEIDDINSLIDEQGGNAYLYGHSSGAVLSLMTAEKLGSKITGLALYEVPYNADTQAQKTQEVYRQKLKQLLDSDKRDDAVSLFVKSVGVTDKQISAMQRLPMWKGLTGMAPTLAYDTIELMEEYPKVNTQIIMTPTLVMYGTSSPDFMGDTARKLSHSMPNAQLQPLDGQTHDVKPDVLAPVLAEFFK
jgi:pimeloyl-ACP methyl ester carboxylesterase